MPRCERRVECSRGPPPRLELGRALETHQIFPRFSNVQLVVARTRHKLAVWIWERGAGVTLASGSSACAESWVRALNEKARRPQRHAPG